MREIIDNLRREAETAIRVLHALKAFRKAVSNERDVILINKNPDFWRIYESSLRTNLFISIRRLYENKSGTFNFQVFIERCISNISLFSKDALRQRKIQFRIAKETIDHLVCVAYEPKEKDFISLSQLVRENSRKMRGAYSQAASKIYAHAVHIDDDEIKKLSTDLNFDDIEKALDSIWHCYNQVWQLYENGREPILEIREYPYKDEVYQCFRTQLM